MINQPKKYSAIPYISYLNPDKEFNRTLQVKLDEIEKQGKISLLRTGNNKKYFSADGLERKNLIWVHTVDNCILQIILRAAMSKSMDELIIYIDQKTLKETSSNLFKYITEQIQRVMIDFFAKSSIASLPFD